MTRFRSLGTVTGLAAALLLAASILLPPAYALEPELQSCTNILINGGFETQSAWILSPSPVPPQYVNSPVQSGSWAMRLGNLGQLPNLASYSSIKQTITIPGNAVSANISFSVWTQSQANPGGDRQELILLPPGATAVSQPVQPLWSELSNVPSWRQFQFAINNQIGSTFDVYFNVYNDGLGGMTGMVLDNVMVTVCQGTPQAPTATPTPSPLPGPAITWVGNLTPNGSSPQTLPAPAFLYGTVEVNAPPITAAPGQGPGITCGLQYGTVPFFGGPWSNLVTLAMAYVGDAGPSDRYGTSMGPLPAGLYQFDAWCSTNGGATKVWSTPTNPGRLTVTGAAPTPTPTPVTPVPTPITPWPTSIPPNCQNLIVNGGFEWDASWVLGPTTLMPYYTGAPNPVHSGARSMALGATLPNSPNVASYSSAQQVVTIPATAQTAQLRFWYFPSSNAAPGGLSRQEVILLDPLAYGETIAVLWRVTENNNAWLSRQIDLTPYRGRTVSVYFNARNAGNGTRTSMFLDDVELLACGGIVTLPADQPVLVPSEEKGGSGAQPIAPAEQYPSTPGDSSAGAVAAAPNPQPTVLTVVTAPAIVVVGPTATATVAWDDTPRGERRSILSNRKLSLTPAALAVIVILIILGAVLLVLYLANRRDRDQDHA